MGKRWHWPRVAANSLRIAKRLLVDARAMRLDKVIEMSAACQALVNDSPDRHEAIDAFPRKRKLGCTGA